MHVAHRLAAALALAVTVAPAAVRAEQRIGYVDLQRALNEVDEGKAARAQLKKDFEEKQHQLDSKTDEIKKMIADFEKQAMVMSDQAKAAKAAEIDRRKAEVQEFYVGLQKELSTRERETTRGIFDKMNGIVREIAEAEGFTMIFEKNDAGLLFAPVSLDITNELIRKYNGRFAAGGAAARAPAPSPAKK